MKKHMTKAEMTATKGMGRQMGLKKNREKKKEPKNGMKYGPLENVFATYGINPPPFNPKYISDVLGPINPDRS